jgi:hypothetical protein
VTFPHPDCIGSMEIKMMMMMMMMMMNIISGLKDGNL